MKNNLVLNQNCVSAQIFRWNLGDCSNKGISSQFNSVVVAFVPTEQEIITHGDGTISPVVGIIRRNIGGREYVHAEPISIKNRKRSCMAGGTFIQGDSRVSRFINNGGYPVSLHDRCE